jgi:uncharacterized iron-regulated membrane protein
MTIKKMIGKVHLWLGLTSGLVVLFLGITGCILAFQKEIEHFSKPYQFVERQNKPFLPPSVLQPVASALLPGKQVHSVTYGSKEDAVNVTFYHYDPATGKDYYYIAWLNPYTGEVIKVKNMNRDFFRVVIMGHFYLWLPPSIGQPIVASATLIFVVMMITGLLLWWPKNKAARRQRFSVKWNAKWRRVNYDMHNVFGFYMTWIAIFIALTGLVMGFQWFAQTVYFTTSGGKTLVAFEESFSNKANKPLSDHSPAVDRIWQRMTAEHPGAATIEVHFPEHDSAAIGAGANPDAGTYWKTDYRYFDQYTLQEIGVKHLYGRYKNASAADKIARMNYDIHVGAIGGLPTKILAFCGSLIAASLPVTGFMIWRGRRKKASKSAKSESRQYLTA